MRKFENLIASPRLIFAVALTIRIIFGVALFRTGIDLFRTNEPSHIAAHVVTGQGFSAPYDRVPIAPTAQQAPGYPLVLASVFAIFGVYSRASLFVMLMINALLGASISVLTYLVGRFYFSPLIGALAAWLWTVWPTTAAADLLLYSYTISTIVVLAWLLVLPIMPGRRSSWGGLGIGLGLALLLNPMLLLLCVAGYPWLIHKPKHTLTAIAAAACVLTPWIIRNYARLGHAYPLLRDNLGFELYVGNHAGMEDNPQPCPSKLCEGTANYNNADFPQQNPHLFASLGEPAFMEEKQHQAIAYIRAQPRKFLVRSAKRFASFWLLPNPISNAIFLVLAAVGIFSSPLPFRRFVLVIFATYPVVFYVTQIFWLVGYRHPLEPLIFLLAAAGIVAVADAFPSSSWAQGQFLTRA